MERIGFMRKVALIDYGKLELQDDCDDIKVLEPGTIKIKVTACSICGSDIALYHGKRFLQSERYFGHEFSGVVVDPGDGANGVYEGMRVASELSRTCGHCWNCRNGLPNYCKSMNEALLPGGFSEETLVLNTPEYSFVSPVPDTIDDITAALLEPTNCAYRVVRQADVKHGETVVILGMGPMGLIAARIIRSMGVDVVVGVDNSKVRLEKVRQIGFVDVVDSNDVDWQAQILEQCGSRGADVVVELTGALPVLQSAFQVVRPGGRIVVGSVYSGFADSVELLPIMRKELTILGAKGPYPHLKTDGTSAAVDMLVKLQDDLKKLITVYDYKDAFQAFEDMISGSVIKPVIRF